MSYVITKNRPGKGGGLEVPTREDGTAFAWAMRFSQGTRLAFADDVEELCAVLCGADYLTLGEQERLVARIRVALRFQVVVQAALVHEAQQNGCWDRLTSVEREVVMAPRFEQPYGWSRDLLGGDWWTATECPLVLVSTGYLDRPTPEGDPAALWWIDPLTPEDLLSSLADVFVLDVFRVADET